MSKINYLADYFANVVPENLSTASEDVLREALSWTRNAIHWHGNQAAPYLDPDLMTRCMATLDEYRKRYAEKVANASSDIPPYDPEDPEFDSLYAGLRARKMEGLITLDSNLRRAPSNWEMLQEIHHVNGFRAHNAEYMERFGKAFLAVLEECGGDQELLSDYLCSELGSNLRVALKDFHEPDFEAMKFVRNARIDQLSAQIEVYRQMMYGEDAQI